MNFDEQFLQEMGLSAMPEDEKQKFLEYIQGELELRIGQRISKGLTETQLNEFDLIPAKKRSVQENRVMRIKDQLGTVPVDFIVVENVDDVHQRHRMDGCVKLIHDQCPAIQQGIDDQGKFVDEANRPI